MKLSIKTIAIATFAVFLMPTFLLPAQKAVNPSTGARDDEASDSGAPAATDSVAGAAVAPMPAPELAAAMPMYKGPNSGTPKIEWFMGYSYLRAVPTLAPANRLVHLDGGSTSIAFNFNRYLGLAGDFAGFNETRLLLTFPGVGPSQDSPVEAGSVFTFMAGPRLSIRRSERITPFAQTLFGGIHASQETLAGCTGDCALLPTENAFAMTAGGGLDVKVRHRLAIRIIQAEYLMTRFENLNTGASASQNDVRLSAGIVLRFGRGSAPLPLRSPLSYSCSVNPSSAFPGDAIAASGRALNLNPEKTAVYTWFVNGGTVSGIESSAKVETTGLAPGAYELKGHVSEGDRPDENADCTATFTVRAFEPPTVGCLADPSSVLSGASSAITATGASPQNRPLTYSFSSTAGSVSGTGSTTTLSTAGAPVGAIEVTCNVVDDKGQTAAGTTSVTVDVPVIQAKPVASDLCSIQFDRDVRRPSRVNNEAKACLDEVSLNLQRNSDARLAIVGNVSSGEKAGKKLASDRAVNAKAYLVSGKGIDPSRIATYAGTQDGKLATTTLIPAGATFDTTGDTPIE